MSLTLITGGCRSGKSAFALRAAQAQLDRGQALYLATAYVRDEEMRLRVDGHREERGACWSVHEPVPGQEYALKVNLPAIAEGTDAVVFDSLTLWVSACLEAAPKDSGQRQKWMKGFIQESQLLLAGLQALSQPVFLVSDETGMGLVPETGEARFFRDCLGRVNQQAASAASTAIFMVSGLPLLLKGDRLPVVRSL